jgi:hypothetical protein
MVVLILNPLVAAVEITSAVSTVNKGKGAAGQTAALFAF